MTTSSQKPQPAYQACLDEGLRQASGLIQQWCSRLQDTLHARAKALAGAPSAHAVLQAIAALRRSSILIEHDFVAELKQTMMDDTLLIPVKKTAKPLRSLSSLSFDDLELMENHQVQETVERARLEQIVRLSCNAALSGFSARLSTLQGFEMVKADRNPLRPDIMVQTLLKVLEGKVLLPEARSCLLLDGSQILGDELESFYRAMDGWLVRQGVVPAAYSVVASPESLTKKTAATPEPPMSQPQPLASAHQAFRSGNFPAEHDAVQGERKKLLTLDHLRRLLAGDYEPLKERNSSFAALSEDQGLHPDFSPTLPAAMDVLTELHQEGLAVPANQARPAPPLPVAQLRAHLKTESRSLGQSLAVEVVGLMIDQIAHDERLLPPVRKIIANSESAFLRLAATDTRFFSDKAHPARKLLDTVTSASLGYASETAPGFSRFMENLQAIAPLLTEEHAGDAQHFATLLEEFERKQARNTPEYHQAQLRAVQALLQAEQRNLLAEKMAAQLKARSDFFHGNRIITAFLTGPWAQVMARERLLAGEGDAAAPAVFKLMLDDLFWSLDLAKVAGHRQQLLRMIPGMLRLLREGLKSIDYPLDKATPFFEELMAIHQIGLRFQPDHVPTPAAEPAPPPASSGRHALEKLFEVPDDAPESQTWLAPTEAQHSGFMQDWDSTTEPATDESAPGQSSQQAQAAGAPGAAQPEVELKLGAWVDMLVDMQWSRAQLVWISPEDTLYMFTSQSGRKHSMTKRVLQHLLMLGFVKVVSAQGVLDRALDSVARTAMRNSMDSDSAF
jgi:hypothetical protein